MSVPDAAELNFLTLCRSINAAMKEVYRINVEKGWFEEERTVGDDIALLHSEVSEMLEAYRDHGFDRWVMDHATFPYSEGHTLEPGEVYPEGSKPEGVASEAADLFIRLLDFCYRYEIDLGAEFWHKVIYNSTRGRRHGGKRL